MYNNKEELRVVVYFRVQHRRVKFSVPKECICVAPEENELMLCCDGAARGNPGRAGAGVVVRDSAATVLGAMSIGFGIQTNYLSELFCVIIALEWAVKFDVHNICIRTDSMGAVVDFSGDILGVGLFDQDGWR